LVDKEKWGKRAGRLYRLTANYRIHLNALVYGVYIKNIDVPEGFITDFASVPRAFWRIVPPFGVYIPAAVAHDYLYSTGEAPRKVADMVFVLVMERLGVPRWKRWLMYRAVRMFGVAPWRRHRQGKHHYGEGKGS
jgi:hypothetical protein